ncbi:hypothetical protein DFH09DRAFT_1400153 [Mycena vulgaris]|nr:hypothetical protein DFH09DRAFT_1400153 [Mycena vulgaris]
MMFRALKSFPSTQIPTSSAPSSSPALPIPTSAARSPSRRRHAGETTCARSSPLIIELTVIEAEILRDLDLSTPYGEQDDIKIEALVKSARSNFSRLEIDVVQACQDRPSMAKYPDFGLCSRIAKYPVGAVATAPPSSASMAGLPRLNRHSSRRAAARAPALDYLRTHQNQSVLNFCAVPMAMATLEPYFGECGVRRRWGVDGSLHRGIAASSLPLRRQGVAAALLLPRASTSPSSLPARPPLLSLRGVAPPPFCLRVASTPSFLPYIDPLSSLPPPSSSLPPLLRCAPLPYINLAILTLAPPADTSAPLFLIIRASPRSFRSSFRSCLCLPPARLSVISVFSPRHPTHPYIAPSSFFKHPLIYLHISPPSYLPRLPRPLDSPRRCPPAPSSRSLAACMSLTCVALSVPLPALPLLPFTPFYPPHLIYTCPAAFHLLRAWPTLHLPSILPAPLSPSLPPRPFSALERVLPPSVPLSLLALPRSVFCFPYARSRPFLPEKVDAARAG